LVFILKRAGRFQRRAAEKDDGDFLLPPDAGSYLSLWLSMRSYAKVAIEHRRRSDDGAGKESGWPCHYFRSSLASAGDGRFDRGWQFMHNLIASIRRRHCDGAASLRTARIQWRCCSSFLPDFIQTRERRSIRFPYFVTAIDEVGALSSRLQCPAAEEPW